MRLIGAPVGFVQSGKRLGAVGAATPDDFLSLSFEGTDLDGPNGMTRGGVGEGREEIWAKTTSSKFLPPERMVLFREHPICGDIYSHRSHLERCAAAAAPHTCFPVIKMTNGLQKISICHGSEQAGKQANRSISQTGSRGQADGRPADKEEEKPRRSNETLQRNPSFGNTSLA